MTGRPLTKRDVEALLGALDGATDAVDEEVVVVREALAAALRVVLGNDGGWTTLVDDAAARGGWDDTRRASLRAAASPTRLADPDTVLADLWDLVTELAERRTV
jgi:hypothetical protein